MEGNKVGVESSEKSPELLMLTQYIYPDVAVKLGFFRDGGIVARLWVRWRRA